MWGSILAIEPVCFLRPGVELAEALCVKNKYIFRAPGSAEKLGAHHKDFFCLSRAPSMETHFAVLGERCKSTNTTPGADRGCEDRVQVDGQAAYVLVSSGGGASSKSWGKKNPLVQKAPNRDDLSVSKSHSGGVQGNARLLGGAERRCDQSLRNVREIQYNRSGGCAPQYLGFYLAKWACMHACMLKLNSF